MDYIPGMSKAFTSEETPDPAPPERELPRLRPGELRCITPEGYACLRAELERLRATPGGEPPRRALLLERTLSAVTVLGSERVPEGVVGFGTWVTVEDEQAGRKSWRLVGPDEADARQGSVSVHSPLGRALMGRRAGETVEVDRPGGTLELAIVAVDRHPPGE